jgi:hypothetical protein
LTAHGYDKKIRLSNKEVFNILPGSADMTGGKKNIMAGRGTRPFWRKEKLV